MKYLLTFILGLALCSCAPTKKELREQIRVLSVQQSTQRIQLETQPEIKTSFSLHEICDTMRIKETVPGEDRVRWRTIIKAKEFEKHFTIGKDSISLSFKDNSFHFNAVSVEKTISEKEQTIQSQKTEITSLKEKLKVRSVWPWWVYGLVIYAALLGVKKVDNLLPFLPSPYRAILDLIT